MVNKGKCMFNKMMLVSLMSVIMFASGCGSEPEATQGTVGPAGASGAYLTSVRTCSKISSGLYFEYSIAFYSTGEKFVKCSISDASAQYSNSAYYLKTQAGNSSATCLLTYDLDASTGGYWTFVDFSPGKATYTDSGSASNNTVVNFTCTLN